MSAVDKRVTQADKDIGKLVTRPVRKTIDIPAGTGKCAGLTGQKLLSCNAKQTVGDAVKKQKGSGKTTEANPGDVSNLILGSPEDWKKALEAQGNCAGLPIPCPLLAIGAGAVLVLILVLR